jgi:hypothetical protein
VLAAIKRRRLLTFYAAQITLAVAVTLAAIVFLSKSSTGQERHDVRAQTRGSVTTTLRSFDPNRLAANAYNDLELPARR